MPKIFISGTLEETKTPPVPVPMPVFDETTDLTALSDDDEPATKPNSAKRPAKASASPGPGVEVIDIDAQDPHESTQDAPLSNFRCPICMEPPQMFGVTECGHMYCSDCIYPALSSARSANRRVGQCSICRKEVSYSRVVFLELMPKETADKLPLPTERLVGRNKRTASARNSRASTPTAAAPKKPKLDSADAEDIGSSYHQSIETHKTPEETTAAS